MKPFATTIFILVSAIACAPTPTPDPAIALATAIQQVITPSATATPSPTETPTIVISPTRPNSPTTTSAPPSPTATATLAPTRTRTTAPTITLPMPTEVFRSARQVWGLVWSNDFENGMGDFSGINIKGGGVLNLVPDFTNSGRGMVLKGTIEGPLILEQGEWKRRAQPERYYDSWYDPKVMLPPIATGIDIWLNKDFTPTKNRWINVLSLFSATAKRDNRYIAGINLREAGVDNYRLVLNNHDIVQ